MQFCWVRAEKPEQMPQKKQPRRKSEEELVSQLRGQTGRVIGGGFPNQAPRNSPHKAEHFHAVESLLCRMQISIKLPSALLHTDSLNEL